MHYQNNEIALKIFHVSPLVTTKLTVGLSRFVDCAYRIVQNFDGGKV